MFLFHWILKLFLRKLKKLKNDEKLMIFERKLCPLKRIPNLVLLNYGAT
jgi:hypothetical protein